MTASDCTCPLHVKMSWRRGKTSGWTAFDLEQRRKKGVEPEAKNESFPSISNSMDQIQNFSKNNSATKTVLEKSFVSVLQHSGNFPALENRGDMGEMKMEIDSSDKSEYVNEKNCVREVGKALEMLRELHPWADQSLIEDVFAGVNNDVDEASSLLKLMVSSEQSYKEIKVTVTEESKSNFEESFVVENKSDTDLFEVSSLLDGLKGLKEDNIELTDEHASPGEMLLHCDSHPEMVLNSVKYIPIEPEWEEDDVYLVHRKEALRMMRSSSRHSKAANDAYLKGDHLSAQLHSQKAHEEWMVAERLNANAAKEILSIRNSRNDQWTLDLHGLHAAEAVQALQEHLQKIESQMPLKHFASASRVNAASDIVLSAAPEFVTCTAEEKWSCEIALSRPRPTLLQVITGKGNHSRGEAALPAAVRSFLIKNRYHYNEARPGVIEVQPRIRR